MRLIDADALKKKADMRGRCLRPLVTAFQMCVTVHDIDDAPTIDAVPVVRCKDCLYWQSGENECEKWEYCAIHNIDIGPHSFCSYGERKEDEGDG